MEEFEITFLEVDMPKLEKDLLRIGAIKVGDYNFRRALFDYPDLQMERKDSWLRLRTDGQVTTLAYKSRSEAKYSDGGTKEIEIVVDDYQKTHDLLSALGFVVKREEENKRTKYKKGETIFDIDSWPMIPTYLEIESTSIKDAQDSAVELGFDLKDSLILSPKEGYLKYGIDISQYSLITFEKTVKK